MKKAIITTPFHRFAGTPEREQRFPKGKTVTEGDDGVTADDIDHWVDIGLASAVSVSFPGKAVE